MFAEFGKSYKDPGDSTTQRDRFFRKVYEFFYAAAICSGRMGEGTSIWKQMAQGMDSFADGYDIILSENASTTTIISLQSNRLSALSCCQFGSDPERCLHQP